MANLWAMHSVGQSLLTYLRQAYDQLRLDFDNDQFPGLRATSETLPTCQFQLRGGNELDSFDDSTATLSLFLYRVTMNEHLRTATRSKGAFLNTVPLSIDLHYLMTIWAPNAMDEQFIFAWAMRQLHQHPVFDASTLRGAEWQTDEVVHVIPAELTNEDLMRIWDAISPTYHLSKAYIARAVRIDVDTQVAGAQPVVATRFLVGDRDRVAGAGR